jgi:hypothetical protein
LEGFSPVPFDTFLSTSTSPHKRALNLSGQALSQAVTQQQKFAALVCGQCPQISSSGYSCSELRVLLLQLDSHVARPEIHLDSYGRGPSVVAPVLESELRDTSQPLVHGGYVTPTYVPQNPWVTMPQMQPYAPPPQPVIWMPQTLYSQPSVSVPPHSALTLTDAVTARPSISPPPRPLAIRRGSLLPTKLRKRSETDGLQQVLRQRALLPPRRNSRVRTPGPSLPPSDASVVSGEWVFVPTKRSRSVDAARSQSDHMPLPPGLSGHPITMPAHTGDPSSIHMFPPTLRGGLQQTGNSVTFY